MTTLMTDNAAPPMDEQELILSIDALEGFCGSDELSLDALRMNIDSIQRRWWWNADLPGKFSDSRLLHRACGNENVTLEIVECILEALPSSYGKTVKDIIGRDSVYPLHFACVNENCPSSVIDLLAKKCPGALRSLTHIEFDKAERTRNANVGLPLHGYLMRESNMDLDVVKTLVAAYPGALTTATSGWPRYTPLHRLLNNTAVASRPDIVQYLVDMDPSESQKALLHACFNKNMSVEIVKILVDRWPESIRESDAIGKLPINLLCTCEMVDDAAALSILILLLRLHPESIREGDMLGALPIHHAAMEHSPEFCKVLIDAYPESLNIDMQGQFPIHAACSKGRVDTVHYLLDLYPERTNMRSLRGLLPIHQASISRGPGYERSTENIKVLLAEDPDCASKTAPGSVLPIHYVATQMGSVHDSPEKVQILFDAHPEGILAKSDTGQTPLDLAIEQFNVAIFTFLETQMDYARQAQDSAMMSGDNGMFPLHNALREKATLGAIKLLFRGNPAALQAPDCQGMLPLHIACSCGTMSVVKFLVDLSDGCLNVCDANGDFPLHHACRSGNCGMIKYMMETQARGASERNNDHKLPIQLLLECGEGKEDQTIDRERPEYAEAVWLLLLAYPETVVNY